MMLLMFLHCRGMWWFIVAHCLALSYIFVPTHGGTTCTCICPITTLILLMDECIAHMCTYICDITAFLCLSLVSNFTMCVYIIIVIIIIIIIIIRFAIILTWSRVKIIFNVCAVV